MSLAWMTTDYRAENWPRVKPTLKSRAVIAWWHVRAMWKWAAGFVTGLILGLALLHLLQARAEQEIIIDFTAPAITAPASPKDSGLLLSYGPRRGCGPEELRRWPS